MSDQDFTEVGALKQILVEQLGLRAEQEVGCKSLKTLIRPPYC